MGVKIRNGFVSVRIEPGSQPAQKDAPMARLGLRSSCIAGAGLIKVGEDGVRSERLTYYTKLPE